MTRTLPTDRRFYPEYVAFLMFAASILNLMDRSILGIVTDQVKADLALNDTQISLISGAAFALFHLGAGVFIARWADRGSRRLILSLGIAIWSLATALTGFATGFWTLLLTRIFVGIGEATAFPIAMSLIGDYFSPARRPRVVAVYQVSNFVGVIAGSIISGLLAKAYGWPMAFIACGAAGLVFAAVNYATLRDPERVAAPRLDHALPGQNLLGSLRELWALPGLAPLAIGYGLSGLSVAVLPVWAPAFFHRSFGLDPAQIGAAVGPFVGGGGLAGILLSGYAAGWLIKRSGRDGSGVLVPLIALPLAAPCFAVFIFADSLHLALPAVGLSNFFFASSLGPCMALAVSITPPRLRSQGSMMMLIAQTVIGAAIGPYIVGLASDLMTPSLGKESLRYALSLTIFAPLLSPLFLWAAYRRITRAADGAQA